MKKSAISWTSYTWNPVHGCSKVSEGCRNCYAERISLEYGHTKKAWTAANASENVQLKFHKLNEIEKIKDPSMVFVNSMSDLFHEEVPDYAIGQIMEAMTKTRRHTYQVLTKRPKRASRYLWPPTDLFLKPGRWPSNVWLGTSAEDQKTAEERIPYILNSNAQVKFLSIEPMLRPIDLDEIREARYLHWIIVGGESLEDKSRRREMSHDWVLPIRDFCRKYQIPFFFKQSSAYRTEVGTSLRHEDGTFWIWQQYPDKYTDPIQTAKHNHAHLEALPLESERLHRSLKK